MKLLAYFRPIYYPTLYLCVLLLFAIACKKDPTAIVTEIDPYANLDSTSHEFAWEIDTLTYPNAFQISPRGIWGSDTDNVYLVGHSDDWKARIWHWNGSTWQSFEDNTAFGFSPTEIIGFGENDIWLVGRWIGNTPPDKKIHRWNGSQWSVVESGIYQERECVSVWGTSSEHLFFGFRNGRIARYDGNRFHVYHAGTGIQIVDIYGISSNEVLACGVRLDNQQPRDSTEYFLFRYDGESWSVRDYHLATVENGPVPFPFNGLWVSGRQLWFGVNGGQIFSRFGEQDWQEVFRPLTAVWRLHGTDLNNIFAAGYWGSSVYHYNGSSWRNFPELSSLDFFGYAVFAIKDQVFIGGINSYYGKAYVIRGKSKLSKGGDQE